MYASVMREPEPMIAGPRTTARSSLAPSCTITRPSTLESISSPSTERSMSSSTRRLASSMSSSCPVSFHQPVTVGLRVAEGIHEVGDAVAQQVVAQVHHERAVLQELLGGQDGVREPQRRVLANVGDAGAELRAVARRRFDLVA